MKRPREDSGGESDDEATEQSRGPSVSLEGGDVTSQGEEGNLPAVEMDVERGEGGEVEPQGEREIPEQRGRAREEEMSRREAEEDLRFKDDLDTRRSRQEEVDSLQNLTLKCISVNTDYFLDHSEDIHSLPGPLCRLVADRLIKNADQTELPDILSLLISEKTWELRLRFPLLCSPPDIWTPETVAKVFGLIEEKCKHTLTHLVLIDYIQPHPVQINTILASLENLTNLTIQGNFGVTDATLLVLGQNCLKLSFLDLNYIKEITDAGVDYLCARAAPNRQCKNLETLNLKGTSVSVDGLVTALSNLPKLKDLSHCDLLATLDKFVKINGVTKKLQLQKLSYDRYMALTPVALENVCKIIPHASTVKVKRVGSLRAFLNINAISIFELRYSDISLPELNSFVTNFSSSLTSFSMRHCDLEIDLSVFGSCPYLEVLELDCCPHLSTGQFQLPPNSFMKLKELTIIQDSFPTSTNVELDVSYFMQMISSPSLCKLRLSDITLPEASLYSLIFEAKENQTVFSSLENFWITDNAYSLDTLKQLICVCPKLSELKCRMSQESKLQLRRFVKRNNLPHIYITAFS